MARDYAARPSLDWGGVGESTPNWGGVLYPPVEKAISFICKENLSYAGNNLEGYSDTRSEARAFGAHAINFEGRTIDAGHVEARSMKTRSM